MENLAIYNCNLSKTITLDPDTTWDNHNRFMTIKEVSFTWICNKTDCFAALYNYHSQTSTLFNITEDKSLLTDAMIAQDFVGRIKLIASITTII